MLKSFLKTSNILNKKNIKKYGKKINSLIQQKFYCNLCRGKGYIICNYCQDGCFKCNNLKSNPCPECSGLGFNGYNYAYF